MSTRTQRVEANLQADVPAAEELDTAKLLAARRLAVAACPYLATALHAVSIVPTRTVPTMAVDRYWRCYVSPPFVAALEVRELAAVWLHEISHLVRDHHGRAQALIERGRRHTGPGTPALDPEHPMREQLRLNIAMDCEINDDLLEGVADNDDLGPRLPEGAVTPRRLRLRPNSIFEHYVRDLPPAILFSRLVWLDCGSGAHGGDCPWELGEDGASSLGEYEITAIRIRVRDAVDRSRGEVPAGWRRWAENVKEPSQDWRTLLGGALRACIAAGSGSGDYTYRRPGRRTPSLGGTVVLPSLRRPLPKVAVVVDTSGSVSDLELGAALSEVAGISRAVGVQGNRISVYSCDAAVHTVQQVCQAQDISLVGGGGTDLRRGIGRAATASPRPDVIVVLTDGGTPWPAAQPGCRVVAGIFGMPRSRYSENSDSARDPIPGWIETVYLN
ncbi:MAG: vWA domain-containing protein [Actinocrinis sp.]